MKQISFVIGVVLVFASCTAIDSGKTEEKQKELQLKVNKILEKYDTEDSEMVLIGKLSEGGDTISE